jgi:phospholipid/cholesterol/gamma-HCH transport system substrate-binding protein
MTPARALTLAALAAALITVAVLLVGSGRDEQRLVAAFEDAGQLVEGGEVQVAGERVGTIDRIRLSDDGLALVTLSVTDPDVLPLRLGTRARIRAVGQAGVANRFVDLSPGAQAAKPLADGAHLETTETEGIVDLDAVLAAFDADTRSDIRGLIARSADVYAGSGAATVNRMLSRLAPATDQVAGFSRELAYDERALHDLVEQGAVAADAVAGRRTDLEAAVGDAATMFGALADERAALARTLDRAPDFLARSAVTLGNVERTVGALRPTLRDVVPAADELAPFLRATEDSLRRADPVLRELRRQLPALRDSLAGFGPLGAPSTRAFGALARGVRAAQPIIRGVRIYGADFALGVTNGLAGIITSNYNATGHYGRLNFVESPQTLFSGQLSELLTGQPLVPNLFETRTHITALCPGANQPPAPDGSNPWIPDPSLCDESNSMPARVNAP